MSRQPRSHATTSLFHVITQGNNKNYIFDRPEDIKYYIKIMYQLQKEHDIEIIAYCIMNNHTHALIRTESISELSKFMLKLNSKYAIYYNKKYKQVGYVFRDRFKSEVICDENHFYNCIHYIYNNPVRAGICKHPMDYPYSNYKANLNNLMKIQEYNYSFIDIEEDIEQICNSFINQFLIKNKVELSDLHHNNILLKNIVQTLNSKYGISLRKISQKLKSDRENTRKIINK